MGPLDCRRVPCLVCRITKLGQVANSWLVVELDEQGIGPRIAMVGSYLAFGIGNATESDGLSRAGLLAGGAYFTVVNATPFPLIGNSRPVVDRTNILP